jgi:hypothetical protein
MAGGIATLTHVTRHPPTHGCCSARTAVLLRPACQYVPPDHTWRVSEGGFEPIAYAPALSAEFAIGSLHEPVGGRWIRWTTTSCVGLLALIAGIAAPGASDGRYPYTATFRGTQFGRACCVLALVRSGPWRASRVAFPRYSRRGGSSRNNPARCAKDVACARPETPSLARMLET